MGSNQSIDLNKGYYEEKNKTIYANTCDIKVIRTPKRKTSKYN